MKRAFSCLLIAIINISQIQAAPNELWQRATSIYQAPRIKHAALTNSPKLQSLIRDGKLYLTLQDAISLAIENNLDIEYQRYNKPAARSELLRAQGGGLLRGVPYTVSETPAGVGGPVATFGTSPATRTTSSTSVSTNPLEIGALSQVQSNLSIQGTIPLSNGSPIPVFDPSFFTRLGWQHQSVPQTNSVVTGTNNLVTETTTGSAGYNQGFGLGTQLGVAFDNSRQVLNSIRNSYSPFTSSGLGLTLTQPLLRGFGSVNKRFIRIAENEDKIVDLLFQQQLISTVYGVTRLYYDFVSLYQDASVKQDALNFAQKLFDDTRAQVEEGTAAQVEQTRANAQLFAARLDLERSQGLVEEQQAILKNVLTRGIGDPEVRSATIVPSDDVVVPTDEVRPIQDIVGEALRNRPDIAQAEFQVKNSEISLVGSRNNLKPQIDLVGGVQNSGLAGEANQLASQVDPTYLGGYGSALGQIFRRNYPTYSAGLQINLPLRNRIAQADVARDEVQVRQTEIRMQQLRKQVQLEVEDALIAMRRARTALEAAGQVRKLQEESLRIEQEKFAAGASTSFFVIQYQSILSQAKSSEVISRNAYVKARAALQRATGSILDTYGISVGKAFQGQM